MTPSLIGRIQTRLGLALLPGVPLALLLAAVLSGMTVGGGLLALAGITLLGLGWELLYQQIQQKRWDRDWPTPFALGSGLPEGVVSWLALGLAGLAPTSFGTHAVFFGAIWLATFLVMQGPIRVLAPHWRFQGMRVVPQPLVTRTASAADVEPEKAPEHEPLPVAANGADEEDRLRLRLPAFPVRLQPATLQRGLGLAALAFVVVAVIAIGRPDPAPEAAGGGGPVLEGPDSDASSGTPGRSGTAVASWDTTARVEPRQLVVPGLGLREKVQKVGLTELGSLQAPEPGRVGWYDEGAAPGQRGPAVLVGDRSTVFSKVASLRRSERFVVTRANGSRVEFVVDRVRRTTADAFPTRKVYGPTKRPELRLVDYAGDEHVIVFAHATSLDQKATHG